MGQVPANPSGLPAGVFLNLVDRPSLDDGTDEGDADLDGPGTHVGAAVGAEKQKLATKVEG